MLVAVVGGTAGLGYGLALRLARVGEEVVIGSRQVEKAQNAAQRVSGTVGSDARVSGTENSESVKDADVVVVAVPFSGQASIYEGIKGSLRQGITVIDCTVPLAAEVGGRATRMLGVWEGSAAQQARGIIGTRSETKVELASGFHTVMAGVLEDLDRPIDADVLVCGDAGARKVAEKLVGVLPGARFVDCGPLENARILESITALIIGINARYKLNPGGGIRITGLP